jgi:SAM-dependent methyltransferase
VTRDRVIETMEGIQDAFDVDVYDRWMRGMRKRGWIETRELLKAGIVSGHALEISPGPGYLGLDWMLKRCRRNAESEGLAARATYVHGDACSMPFADATYDAVFANGGMHEWADPTVVFDQIARVLRPGGRYCVTDLRRDMNTAIKAILWISAGSRVMRAGLLSSIHAAYLPSEARALVARSKLVAARVTANPIGIVIAGEKA